MLTRCAEQEKAGMPLFEIPLSVRRESDPVKMDPYIKVLHHTERRCV
jgi:hypothetical protein